MMLVHILDGKQNIMLFLSLLLNVLSFSDGIVNPSIFDIHPITNCLRSAKLIRIDAIDSNVVSPHIGIKMNPKDAIKEIEKALNKIEKNIS